MPEHSQARKSSSIKSAEELLTEIGAVNDDHWGRRACELVAANAGPYPELLASQLATAMRGEAAAIAQAYRMRTAMAVCLRLVERAKVKPVGDEVEMVKIGEEYAFAHPARRGGNQWLEPDELRKQLKLTEICEPEAA